MATFETLRETEGLAKYPLHFGAFGELIAARFYQINAVVAEAAQIADTFVAFCLIEKPKFLGKDLPTSICFEVLPTIMIICSRNWSK